MPPRLVKIGRRGINLVLARVVRRKLKRRRARLVRPNLSFKFKMLIGLDKKLAHYRAQILIIADHRLQAAAKRVRKLLDAALADLIEVQLE